MPHVAALLTTRATSVLAAWHVFSPVAARLGPAAARSEFLQPLLRLYQRDAVRRVGLQDVVWIGKVVVDLAL